MKNPISLLILIFLITSPLTAFSTSVDTEKKSALPKKTSMRTQTIDCQTVSLSEKKLCSLATLPKNYRLDRILTTIEPALLGAPPNKKKLRVTLYSILNPNGVFHGNQILIWEGKANNPKLLWRQFIPAKSTPFSGETCFENNQSLFWMDINGDKKSDLIFLGNDAYCPGTAIFLNNMVSKKFNETNFKVALLNKKDDLLFLDLNQDGSMEIVVKPGLVGRVGAEVIESNCEELMEGTSDLVKSHFLKLVGEPYLDEKDNKSKRLPSALYPFEKIKILGFEAKNKLNLIDQTSQFKDHLKLRLKILNQILASPRAYTDGKRLSQKCRSQIQKTKDYLKRQIEN